jgi:hypothetical protein
MESAGNIDVSEPPAATAPKERKKEPVVIVKGFSIRWDGMGWD